MDTLKKGFEVLAVSANDAAKAIKVFAEAMNSLPEESGQSKKFNRGER